MSIALFVPPTAFFLPFPPVSVFAYRPSVLGRSFTVRGGGREWSGERVPVSREFIFCRSPPPPPCGQPLAFPSCPERGTGVLAFFFPPPF